MIKDKFTYLFYRTIRFTVITITRVLCLAKIYGKENIVSGEIEGSDFDAALASYLGNRK